MPKPNDNNSCICLNNINTRESTSSDDNIFADGTLTVGMLKKEFGIAVSTAYELMGKGILKYSKPARNRLISRKSVQMMLLDGLPNKS